MILTDRDFGDEDEFDWESLLDDPEEFVVDEESWEELQRRILEDEEFEDDD